MCLILPLLEWKELEFIKHIKGRHEVKPVNQIYWFNKDHNWIFFRIYALKKSPQYHTYARIYHLQIQVKIFKNEFNMAIERHNKIAS